MYPYIVYYKTLRGNCKCFSYTWGKYNFRCVFVFRINKKADTELCKSEILKFVSATKSSVVIF